MHEAAELPPALQQLNFCQYYFCRAMRFGDLLESPPGVAYYDTQLPGAPLLVFFCDTYPLNPTTAFTRALVRDLGYEENQPAHVCYIPLPGEYLNNALLSTRPH
jgi:hypothetical protein